jgi:hypothetical protein
VSKQKNVGDKKGEEGFLKRTISLYKESNRPIALISI